MNLFVQLKQRKLVQWLLAYAAGAWLLLQVVGLVGAQFGWSPTLMRGFTIAAGVGVFVVLLLAWYHGERGAQKVSGMEWLLLTLLLAIGGGLLWAFAPGAPPAGEAKTEPVARVPATPGPPDPSPGIKPNSIAVLPFVNMSTDAENGFFADGISEELLNVLAGVKGLTVASRTSAFSFKGKDTPIPEIARQLGVQHVLEGSVRKQGNRVRITAQLIKAGSDAHLWSETYDRDLTDIFVVQEEIAQAITRELEDVLGKQQVSVTASTANLAAYEHFLTGRARFQQRTDLKLAIEDLSKAVELDANFGEAWVYLAAAWLTAPGYYNEDDLKEADAIAQASAAMERADVLAPRHPMLLAAQANFLDREGKPLEALAIMRDLAPVSTQDATPMLWHGLLLLRAGYVQEATAVLERGQQADPLSGIGNGYLAIARLSAGRYAEAEASARKALAQGWTPAIYIVIYELAGRGERQHAVALWDELGAQGFTGDRAGQGALVRKALVDPSVDVSELASGRFSGRSVNFELGLIGHRFDLMLDEADRMRKQNPRNIRSNFWMRSAWMPSTLALREDPRFFEFAESKGLVRLWESRGYPDGCKRAKAASGDHLDCEARP